MIAIAIATLAITVIGVGQSVRLVLTDGRGRVPTRTYPSMYDLR